MSDDVRLVGQLRPLSTHPQRHQAANGYQSAGEVQSRARVSRPMDGPEFRRAVDKLQNNLENGRELRRDVPRGFYLNITI